VEDTCREVRGGVGAGDVTDRGGKIEWETGVGRAGGGKGEW
jgi:hypothetical protein